MFNKSFGLEQIISKKARLKLQGRPVFRQQLADAGGVYNTKEVADLLNISSDAVRKRAAQGRFLIVRLGEQTCYPVWQFDDGNIVEHFTDVMIMLDTTSSVGVVQFFLSYDEDLEQTPIEALKSGDPDKLAIVEILAKQFNQQVAR